MSDVTVLEIATRAVVLAAKLAAPVLIVALVVGFTVSLLQSVTQLQDVTLSFVPKLVAVGVALLVFGRWMLAELTSFTSQLYADIPELVRGG